MLRDQGEYSRELPRLTNSPSAGVLRVYDIVLELISHVDAHIDAESLTAFVAAYQTVSALRLGELWAIPIMLRLGLIENLQRVTTGLASAREDRDLASVWVDRLQDMAETNPSRLVIVVADMARADLRLSSSFVAEFCQRLSRLNPVLHLARGWLEQRLAEQGLSIEQLVHLESQNQAADQVSVSHSIASLRFLSAMDWKGFVESLSLVDQTLRKDPAGVFGEMGDGRAGAVEAAAGLRLVGDPGDLQLDADEFASRIAALVEVVRVDQPRQVVVRPVEDGPQERGVVGHGGIVAAPDARVG